MLLYYILLLASANAQESSLLQPNSELNTNESRTSPEPTTQMSTTELLSATSNAESITETSRDEVFNGLSTTEFLAEISLNELPTTTSNNLEPFDQELFSTQAATESQTTSIPIEFLSTSMIVPQRSIEILSSPSTAQLHNSEYFSSSISFSSSENLFNSAPVSILIQESNSIPPKVTESSSIASKNLAPQSSRSQSKSSAVLSSKEDRPERSKFSSSFATPTNDNISSTYLNNKLTLLSVPYPVPTADSRVDTSLPKGISTTYLFIIMIISIIVFLLIMAIIRCMFKRQYGVFRTDSMDSAKKFKNLEKANECFIKPGNSKFSVPKICSPIFNRDRNDFHQKTASKKVPQNLISSKSLASTSLSTSPLIISPNLSVSELENDTLKGGDGNTSDVKRSPQYSSYSKNKAAQSLKSRNTQQMIFADPVSGIAKAVPNQPILISNNFMKISSINESTLKKPSTKSTLEDKIASEIAGNYWFNFRSIGVYCEPGGNG